MDISKRLNSLLLIAEGVEDDARSALSEDEIELEEVDLNDLEAEGIPVIDFDDYAEMVEDDDLDEEDLETVDLHALQEAGIPIMDWDDLAGDSLGEMMNVRQSAMRRAMKQAQQITQDPQQLKSFQDRQLRMQKRSNQVSLRKARVNALRSKVRKSGMLDKPSGSGFKRQVPGM